MKLTATLREWLLHSEHPDPSGVRKRQREALVRKMEQNSQEQLAAEARLRTTFDVDERRLFQ